MIKHTAGDIAIKSKLRTIEPLLVGPSQKMRLILTAGVTENYSTIEKEVEKIRANLKYGVDMINDVTINSREGIRVFQKKLINSIPLPVKSVPGYELYLYQKEKGINIVGKEEFLAVLEEQALRGIDAFTIHPYPTREVIEEVEGINRNIKLTARGGGLVYEYMKRTGKQNPFFEYFDEIADLAAKYQIVLSFGQSFRPGCLADRPDNILRKEMDLHARLAKRANDKQVKTMAEVLGHIRLADLGDYMKRVRKIFPNTVLTCMGPILTDVSIGHDHITSAIGAVLAGLEGVDMVVNITPDEHIKIPTLKAIREGVIAHKIALHIVDTWKVSNLENDIEIGKIRKATKECFTLDLGRKFLIDPDNKELDRGIKECTMCGDFCPRRKIK